MNTNLSVKALNPAHIQRGEFIKKLRNGKYLLILAAPAIVFLFLFNYLPMWGVLISFKQYTPFKGFADSPWVGMKHFITFFSSPFALQYIKNTFLLSAYSILWGFPAPIILALLLNEVRREKFKKLVQTVSYMPHFYSTVVVAGLFTMFLSPINGPVMNLLVAFGFERVDLLAYPQYFRTIFIASDIWQNCGWGAIIYLAAIANIDVQLYEASTMDGASKFKRMLYITLPCMAPTIVTMLLLRLGQVMNVGFERAFLFQRPSTYEVSQIIQTYVYKMGVEGNNFSYASAIGLFNSLVNLVLLYLSNRIAKRLNDTSLW